MIPIVLHSGQTLDKDSFIEYLITICREHKEQNRALAFAFIVHDFGNHTIREILENHNYWSALDKISGPFLSIFYIDSQENYFQRRQDEILWEQINRVQGSSIPGLMEYLVPVSGQDIPLEESVRILIKEFDKEKRINTPFVLFFQTDGDAIIDYFIVALKQEEIEKAFLELKTHIRNAVESVSEVTPDNVNNYQEIFNLIKNRVEGSNQLEFIKSKVVPKISLGTLISLIKLMFG